MYVLYECTTQDDIIIFSVTHLYAFLHKFPYLSGIIFQPAGIMYYLSQLLLVIGQNFGIFR